MFKYVLLLQIAMLNTSNAAEVKAVFKDSKGAEISVTQAVKLSESGEQIYRCQPVKAEPNKSGTSITFKVAK